MLLIQHTDSYYLKYEEIESTMSTPLPCFHHITTCFQNIDYNYIRIIIDVAGLEYNKTREMKI